LWAYPRRWREQHGEALLGTALDAADAEGRDRPTRREVADLVVHGLATRTGLLLPSPRVLHPAAVAAVVLGSALALTALVLGELAPPYRPNPEFYTSLEGRWGPFSTVGPALYLVWVTAVGALALGRHLVARCLLALAALVAVALVPLAAQLDVNRPPRALLLGLAWCAVLGAAGLGHAPRATASAAVTGAVGLVAIATLASGGPPALLPPAVDEATRWADTYQTFPFYGGIAGAVTGVVLMLVAAVALLVVLARRRPLLVLAVLLVAPGTLPWTTATQRVYWNVMGEGVDRLWTHAALALPLVALVADRLSRPSGKLRSARDRPGAAR
jgi:hypothetical protein